MKRVFMEVGVGDAVFFFACKSEGNDPEDVSVPLQFLDTSSLLSTCC